jgi:Na+/pantothenate symporter
MRDLLNSFSTVGAICCFALALATDAIQGVILAIAAVMLLVRSERPG